MLRNPTTFFHGVSHWLRNESAFCQQLKRVACALRDAEFVGSYQVMGDAERGFTGALDVQDGSVLMREVGGKVGASCSVFFACASHAAFNGGGFVE